MLGHLGLPLKRRPLKYGREALMRSRKGVYSRSTRVSSSPALTGADGRRGRGSQPAQETRQAIGHAVEAHAVIVETCVYALPRGGRRGQCR